MARRLTGPKYEFEALYWDDRPVRGEVKANGSFEIKDIPADTYRLRIFPAKALQDYFLKSVNLGGKDVTDSGFGVGGTSYSLDVIASANGASVDGVVLDKDKPASDARVICFPDASHRERQDLYRVVRTDYRGRFSLYGLNPGEYRVFTLDDDVDEDEVGDPEFVHVHQSLGQNVRLDEGEHKSIVLRLAASDD